jgi:hypothetical protein
MTTRKIYIFLASLIWSVPMIVAAQSNAVFSNPLKDIYSTIPGFIAGFLQAMVQISLPVVAFFMLLAGYQFAAAGGNPEKLNKAKENFIYVLVGALLILGAWVLATLIGNTVSQVIGNGT